ncbi:hypothetical protein Hypma_005158 [Hypsizygus marmoreus]|uniref:Uncharacterized protein n=1 Tax=Hypsizygus marmoreus TaxID=39966 RepID=A0A369JZ78_HYPMA|nr:hypothetical protein Hypma_005158 [Hypsizygus marmoreus]
MASATAFFLLHDEPRMRCNLPTLHAPYLPCPPPFGARQSVVIQQAWGTPGPSKESGRRSPVLKALVLRSIPPPFRHLILSPCFLMLDVLRSLLYASRHSIPTTLVLMPAR